MFLSADDHHIIISMLYNILDKKVSSCTSLNTNLIFFSCIVTESEKSAQIGVFESANAKAEKYAAKNKSPLKHNFAQFAITQ